MKKLLLVLISIFALTACSSDDENLSEIESQLLGKWFFENPNNNPNPNNSFTFTSNGSVTYTYINLEGNNYLSEIGTYSFNGDVMTMIFPEGVSLTFVQRVVFISDNLVEFVPTGVPGENPYDGDYFRDNVEDYDIEDDDNDNYNDNDNNDDNDDDVNINTITTTMIVTLNGPDQVVTLEYRDLDGPDGPDSAEISVSGALTAGVTYDGSIRLLNESEEEVEEITEEIEEEDDEHQFFYTVGTGLDVTYAYADEDENGNPVGLAFTLTTGAASSGILTFTLRHEPNKPNTGLEDAEGSTDIEKSFDLEVQ